jgi:flagella basal body P-ring formation protein FlgA
MRVLSPIFAAVLFLACVASPVARSADRASVHVSLKADAMVSRARVTLGDVATMDDGEGSKNGAPGNPAIVKTLSAIDLGSAPLPGYTDRTTRKEIERLVRSRGLDATVIWDGADAVRIERIAKAADSAQLVDSATAYLGALLRGEGYRVELQLAAPLPEIRLPTGRIELKPRALLPAQALHRRVAVWVDVLIDGAFVRSVTVPLQVQAFKNVLVAKRDLPKGAAPQCDTLSERAEDVAALDSAPFPADCKLVQGNLRRAMALGTPLLKSNLQAPIAVAQGDSVSLQLVAGALTLESRAVAIADGEVGQRIAVRPSLSTDTIIAEVIAPGVVKVTGK